MTTAELYELYSELRLSDDWEKVVRQSGLAPLQRRAYAEACAWYMNERETQEISEDEATGLVRRVVKLRPSEDHPERLERIMTDLRTCSFMTTGTKEGGLRFIHKSFQEYFLACRLLDSILVGKIRSAIRAKLPDEAIYFLGSMAMRPEAIPSARSLRQALRDALHDNVGDRDAGSVVAASNLLGAMMHADPDVTNVRVASVRPGPTSWGRHAFVGCHIERLELRDFDLGSLELVESRISELFFDTRLSRLAVTRCSVGLEAHGSVDTVSFTASQALVDVGKQGLGGSCGLLLRDGSRVSIRSGSRLFNDAEISVERSLIRCEQGVWFSRLSVVEGVAGIVMPDVASSRKSAVAGERSLLLVQRNANIDEWHSGKELYGAVSNSVVLVDPGVPLSLFAHVEFTDCTVVGGSAPILEGGSPPETSFWQSFSGSRVLCFSVTRGAAKESVHAIDDQEVYVVRMGDDRITTWRDRFDHIVADLLETDHFRRGAIVERIVSMAPRRDRKSGWDPEESVVVDFDFLGGGLRLAEGPLSP